MSAVAKVLPCVLVLGCAPTERAAVSPRPAATHDVLAGIAASPVEPAGTPAAEPPPEFAGKARAAVLDPATLGRLESMGFSLGDLVLGQPLRTGADLDGAPAFRTLFDVLRNDLRQTAGRHPRARVTSVDGFRLFDERWLGDKEMSYVLTGIFNRLDRKAFYEGTCGEVRFVYRLSYETQQGGAPMTGRLPMTVNVVFLVDAASDSDCLEAARSWSPPEATREGDVSAWLLQDGALAPPARRRWSLKAVETNLQTVRLQSSVHPTLAGHIEYGMRVFHPAQTGGGFVPAPMENMVDVSALSADAERRHRLLEYLRRPEVLDSIDRGTLRLPDEFVATQALSVSPRGLSRRANRPFRRLFQPETFRDLDLARYRTIRSPVALLRRLDGATCTGCHQSHSIAGFHHVGMDGPDSPRFNALLSGASPHLLDDLERRRHYTAALARQQPPDEFRPVPERQGLASGRGAPCGLGDPGLREWTCAPGLECVSFEDAEVGACESPGTIGAPCEYGTLLPNDRPERDYVRDMTRPACGADQACDRNVSGFPLGACASVCADSDPASTCGDFLDVDGFQNCLRARQPFDRCAERFAFQTGLRSCDVAHPCRQDYVCVRTAATGVGACQPPYFVYQLRLDGYPLPR